MAALTEKPGGSAALDPPAAAGTEAKGSKDQDGAKPEGPDAAAGAAGAAGAADAAGAAGGGAGGPAGRAAGRDWLRAVPVLQAVRMLAYGEARGREALAAAGACEALAALLRQHPLPPSYRPAPAQPLRLRPAPRPPSPLTGPAPRPRDCPRDRVPRPPRKPAPAKLGAREAQGAAQCASSITATAQVRAPAPGRRGRPAALHDPSLYTPSRFTRSAGRPCRTCATTRTRTGRASRARARSSGSGRCSASRCPRKRARRSRRPSASCSLRAARARAGGTSGGTAGETARGGKRAAWQARCIRRLRGACCVQ